MIQRPTALLIDLLHITNMTTRCKIQCKYWL